MQVYPPDTCIAGRYKVASQPLMGGMGIVYLCHDLEEDRPVALKTFRPEYLPDRAARDRFLREGTAWVDLGAHPHIVRCYQVVRVGDGSEVYLVLELVAKDRGRADASLRSWMAPGVPLPVERALLFALQAARGMAHAAGCLTGFVHRDLKPENLLVGADRLSDGSTNRLRITDFGLANVLQESSSQPVTDLAGLKSSDERPRSGGVLGRTQLTRGIVGTPLYMAPEQWQGKIISTATDIYALGCTLYEMVAGQQAVDGRTPAALRQAHCQGQWRPLPTGLSREVCEVVARCLAVEPGERYGNWVDVGMALEMAYLAEAGQVAPTPIHAAVLTRAGSVAAGWSYNEIGSSYLDLGKAEVAVGCFERAEEVGKAEGASALVGVALSNLGIAYKDLGDANKAIGCHEKAVAIAREIGDRRLESNALGSLGNACAALGDARRAIDNFEQCLAIHTEIGDRRGEAADLTNIGLIYAGLGDARQAICYYERALALAREIGDRKGEENSLASLGLAFARLGDARQAISFHEQALTIAREIGDRHGEGSTLGNLGNVYVDLGETHRAIAHHEQHLAVAREIRDQRGEGTALGNLGTAYYQLGDARRAIGYFEKHLSIAREIRDRQGEANALGNLGNACFQLRDVQQAIGYFDQQLLITREIGDRRGEGTALGNMGTAYTAYGSTVQAIEYWQQAIVILEGIGDMMNAALFSFNLALLFAQHGHHAEALPYAQRAAQFFVQIGHGQMGPRAKQLLAQIRARL